MSFSSDVKEELINVYERARHCQLAELCAIVHFAGKTDNNAGHFDISVENEYASRKYFTLLRKTFNINSADPMVADAIKLPVGEDGTRTADTVADPRLITRDCCRRAYLRGAFLACGTISDPAKEYHLEYQCRNRMLAAQLMDILNGYGVENHPVMRRRTTGIYVKEGESIVSLLGLMGAHTSLMSMENTRILKEIGNNVNRRVNCETANIAKTVAASARQVADIEYIIEHHGLEILPDRLRAIAQVRLENPEATLTELGELLTPPVGKSGVSHRLKDICGLAEALRNESQGE